MALQRFLKIWLTLLFAVLGTPAHADDFATVKSPNGEIAVTIGLGGYSRIVWSATRRGKPVVNQSHLGFLLTDATKLDGFFSYVDQKRRSVDQRWTQPWGEWKTIRDHYNEVRVRFRENKDLRREVAVVFRVFDDGIGFRYEIPDQPNLKTMRIGRELTEFALASSGRAWWTPAGQWNRYEYLYNKTAIDQVGTAHTPMTVALADGTHIAFHEAALVDYAGMWLRHLGANRFIADLAPGASGASVVRDTPFATPWRTLAIADDAPGLYAASRISLSLNEPNALGDVSGWIKPGKFMGVWWNMISGKWTWARGAQHGATTTNVKRYIDFAAANGIPSVLVEGWNVGWDGDWYGHGDAMRFTQPTEDFDAEGLAAYAKSKGVALIGHHETGGASSNYDAQLDAAFAWAAAHGERVVKTGYVADAGQIERVDPDGKRYREWHDGQWQVNHHMRVVQAAAKHRVSVDAHEPVKDTGLRRTYPNWVSREGARGQEYMSWSDKNPPDHEPILVFTRMLSGPMDFTPGLLKLKGEKDSDVPSTIARQLAQYVVIYSPFAMAADTPEAYAKVMDAFQFIKDVPTDWEDTRVLNGAIGEYATFARKDRNSADWYIGSLTNGDARTLIVTLDFLPPGRTYTAQIYRDAPDTDYRTPTRYKYVIESKPVKRGDTLTLTLAPGGGQAIRLKAPGRK